MFDVSTRRLLRKTDVTRYLSVSETTFNRWVKCGLMPCGKRQGRMVFWDRHEIDKAVDMMLQNKKYDRGDGQCITEDGDDGWGILDELIEETRKNV